MLSVVVTGASSGIGRQISKTLTENGYRVFGSVRSKADGKAVASELGENFTPLVFDVTNQKQVLASVKLVKAELKGETLAGLINNAGIAVFGAVQNLDADEFRYQFDVNLMGVFHCTQAYLDLLGADASRTGKAGKIINISSVSGELGMPFMSAYNMSKFGLEGFSEALRRELMVFGIDVVIIAPGPVKTAIWGKVDKSSMLERYDNSVYRSAVGKMVRYTDTLEQSGCDPEVISQRALSILTNDKTKTRYTIDVQSTQNRLLSWLPKRMADKMVAKQMGLEKS
ncbi:SDR family NAD(P)-dependent oxidoreductase [Alphaproteobacteria bacterium]|jgi:NAD(P)-dependent dehydrogenase (short-subunit alcohol dehydrogenase family)|nr:SDR family NAD(P)-dependent oxidoreductase [Alphaproteobacteria bacterium]